MREKYQTSSDFGCWRMELEYFFLLEFHQFWNVKIANFIFLPHSAFIFQIIIFTEFIFTPNSRIFWEKQKYWKKSFNLQFDFFSFPGHQWIHQRCVIRGNFFFFLFEKKSTRKKNVDELNRNYEKKTCKNKKTKI